MLPNRRRTGNEWSGQQRWRIAAVATAVLAVGIVAAAFAAMHIDAARAIIRVFRLEIAALREGIEMRRDVMIAMPDGTRLATDIYLPDRGATPAPALLVRLPYGKSTYGGALQWVHAFGPRGYAVVVQDMRGRFGSEGVFAPYDHAVSDGAATLDWIAAQSWSNGRVATVGCSALGEHQAILAKARNPHHTALLLEAAGGAIGRGGASRGYFGFYEGGIPTLASGFGWFAFSGGKTPDAMAGADVDPAAVLSELPTGTLVSRHRRTPTDFEAFMRNFGDDAYWDRLGYLAPNDRFASPALHVNTWQDLGVRGTFEIAALMRANAENARARDNQPVVIGPGNHCTFSEPFDVGAVGDLKIEKSAAFDYDALYASWLDHWLRDGPMPELAPYTFYVLGADRWQTSNVWPPADTRELRFYLAPDGRLQTSPPQPGSATYKYDPTDPTPSIGGAICCTGDPNMRAGPLDQRPNDARSDLLSFRSMPLDAPLSIIGDISAELTISTDVPDTDLIVTLLDIHPDGVMLPIQQGVRRMRYRRSFDAPQDMPIGKPIDIALVLVPAAVTGVRQLRMKFRPVTASACISHRRASRGSNATSIPAGETISRRRVGLQRRP